jgi:predicted TIM-barrel fold metal-dependent hydrolase
MNDKFDPHYGHQIQGDRMGKAWRWVQIYNKWMVDTARQFDRIRPVPPLLANTVEELLEGARAFIDQGIRAIWLPSGMLPGGKSPAHTDLDPFWKLMADSKCVVTLHIGTEGKFFESLSSWADAPVFEGYRGVGEFRMDPWFWSVTQFPSQNFIATMINGRVFERHPELRVGVIEVGAYWVGPMIEQLDLWYENIGRVTNNPNKMREKPSFYLKRNVRATNFYFEKIDEYIERYDLGDVLCFSTDYPHVEGGKDIFNAMYNRIERLGPTIVENYFVNNGRFLFPH